MSKRMKWILSLFVIVVVAVLIVEKSSDIQEYYWAVKANQTKGTVPATQSYGVTLIFENEQDREEFINSVYREKYSNYSTSKDSLENKYRYHIQIMDEGEREMIKKEIEEMENTYVKDVEMY